MFPVAEADNAVGAGEEKGCGRAPDSAGGGWTGWPRSSPGPLWAAPGATAGAQVTGHPAQGRTHPQIPDCPSQGRGPSALPSHSLRPRASACFSPGGHRPSCKAGEQAGPSRHLSRLVMPGQSCSSKARKTLCGPSPLRKQLSVQEETNRSTAGQDVKSGKDSPSGRAGPQPRSQSTVLWAPRGADG